MDGFTDLLEENKYHVCKYSFHPFNWEHLDYKRPVTVTSLSKALIIQTYRLTHKIHTENDSLSHVSYRLYNSVKHGNSFCDVITKKLLALSLVQNSSASK